MAKLRGSALLTGEALVLGALVGEGGEAEVYEVIERSDVVVKRPREAPEPEVIQKWQDMLSTTPPSDRVNWPIDLWVDGSHAPRGLLLKRVQSVSAIHGLYNPGTRFEKFPNATAKDLVRVALDLTKVVVQLHRKGWVAGDLNPTNVLLNEHLRIHLIDSDSMQLDVDGRRHPCHVGHPLFLAPEWQGKRLRDSQRNSQSDVFTLAVQVYHLLHFGRHPFAGRWLGEGESPTVEEAITSGWYVHCSESPLQPPIMSVSPTVWGADLDRLFLKSFSVDPSQRPTSQDWLVILQGLHLEMHSSNCGVAKHAVRRSNGNCCWCDFARHGVDLFAQEDHWIDFGALDKATQRLHVLLGRLNSREVPEHFEAVFGQIERPVAPLFADWHWSRSKRKAIAVAREDAWQLQLDEWLGRRDHWNRRREEILVENARRHEERKKALQALALVEEVRDLGCRKDVRLRFELSLVHVQLEPHLIPDIGPGSIQRLNEAGLANAMLLSKRTLRHVEGIGYARKEVLLRWRQRKLRSLSEASLSHRHTKGIIGDLGKDVLNHVAMLERRMNR